MRKTAPTMLTVVCSQVRKLPPHVRRDVQKVESDTESVVSRQNFRDLDDSHDQLRRVRQRVNRTDVAAVVEVFRTLFRRVGPVTANQEVPRMILRQTWSALNVPLMWAASSGDAECPVLLWLAHAGEQVEALSQGGRDLERTSSSARWVECFSESDEVVESAFAGRFV